MTIHVRGLAPLLQVFDMPTSIRFYRDVLGMRLSQTSEPRGEDDVDWALLELDGAQLMLNTAYEFDSRPPAPDPARIAAHRDAAVFFGCPDVDAAYAHLRAAGVAVQEPILTHYGFRSLSVRDPDGYDLVFHWPAGEGETSKATAPAP